MVVTRAFQPVPDLGVANEINRFTYFAWGLIVSPSSSKKEIILGFNKGCVQDNTVALEIIDGLFPEAPSVMLEPAVPREFVRAVANVPNLRLGKQKDE